VCHEQAEKGSERADRNSAAMAQEAMKTGEGWQKSVLVDRSG